MLNFPGQVHTPYFSCIKYTERSKHTTHRANWELCFFYQTLIYIATHGFHPQERDRNHDQWLPTEQVKTHDPQR